jgi:hypothetical protein
MSNPLRRFNQAGTDEFVRRILALRAGEKVQIDDAFVTDAALTEVLRPEVEMERPAFKTKRDAGAYLSEKTREARRALGGDEAGLWTWLSAWHWDAVCPATRRNRGMVLHPVYYVFGHGGTRARRQHLLAIATEVFEKAPGCDCLLSGPADSLTRIVHEAVTRLPLMRLSAIYDLLNALYWDAKAMKVKRRAVGNKPSPGDLRSRLPARIQQLEMTHDLTELSADQLLVLLGEEFQTWATPPERSGGGGGGPRRPRVPAAHP